MSDFRIIVHMHHFFEDHRSSCRLFITSKIKTIRDLQNHISNLFDLHKDFYLISNNFYLPNLEDVRVLREDDLVVVIPCDRRSPSNGICNSQAEGAEFPKSVVDKTLKRSRTVLNETENFDFQESNGVKKKKKRKNIETEAFNSINSEPINVKDASKEQKKEKKIKKELPQEQCDGFENENKIKRKPLDVPVNNHRLPCIVPRKNIKLMDISTKPKVVKSIFVNDAPADVKYKNNVEFTSIPRTVSYDSLKETNNLQTFGMKYPLKASEILKLPSEGYKNQQIKKPLIENNNTETEQINTNKNVNIITVQTFNTEQHQNNNEQLLKNESIGPQLIPLKDSTSKIILHSVQVNPEHTCEIISHSVQVNPDPTSETDSHSVQVNPDPTSETDSHLVQVNPLEEELECDDHPESIISTVTEESGVDVSSVEIKQKRKRVRKRKSKKKTPEIVFQTPVVYPKPVFTSAAPVMHIRFENDNQTRSNNVSEDTAEVIDVNSSEVIDSNLNYDNFCKEELFQYPIMKQKLPKKGDVIAFKICKLSESYTPEISDVIIAKVLSYCPSTDNVVFKIIEGADECSTPEGKFYMEINDNDVEEEEGKSFSWKELIEPRLLFP